MALVVAGTGLAALALVPYCIRRQQHANVARAGVRAAATDDDDGPRRVSWVCPSLGSFSLLERQESGMPPVGDDECLVAVKAIGLNYADVFMVLGLYEAFNKALAENDGAAVPGFEFAGEVVQVGPSVSQHAVGDRVFGFCRFGAYRTSVVVRETLMRRAPDDWSYAEAASVLVQGLTAWHGLVELGRATKGSQVLVHSAAGGVGCAALEICDAIGASAVGVVGSEEKVPFLKERYPKCTPLVRTTEKAYAKQLDALETEFDVCLESLGGKYLTAALARLAPMGRMVHFGATAAYGGSSVDGLRKWLKLVPNYLRRPLVDPGELVPRNIALIGFNLVWLTERETQLARELEQMLTVGGLARRPPAVGATFPFAELPQALDYLRSGRSTGKVVVTVDADDCTLG